MCSKVNYGKNKAGREIMHITKILIESFKCFSSRFVLELNPGMNILVGKNGTGKSSIIEAITLALSGLITGRYAKNEMSQYLFNERVLSRYFSDIANGIPTELPRILIELYFNDEDDLAILKGNSNTFKENCCGISCLISFDEKYRAEYNAMIENGQIKSLPIEYYEISWLSFARQAITPAYIPIKSAVVDTSIIKNSYGVDSSVLRILRDCLSTEEAISITQAHRKMKEVFAEEDTLISINTKINSALNYSGHDLSLSMELSSKNAWESSLVACLDRIPFQHIGKGEQCIIKTKLALQHKRSQQASTIMVEEPENHLTFSKLNALISQIKNDCTGKQIIVTTHSSFVANKLGLDSIILLHEEKTLKFDFLLPETKSFFEKIAGYDTLRLVLCKRAILVEGDSDELIVQKAYYQKKGKLPIDDDIDVISVGMAFLRFLEIASHLKKKVCVVTDNDGDIDALGEKYHDYLGDNKKPFIDIFYDQNEYSGTLTIGKKNKPFNYNTLEPNMVRANGITNMNAILGTCYTTEDEMHKFMRLNKTDCALKLFTATQTVEFPDYINKAISCDE